MKQIDSGYLVWEEDAENYVMTDDTLEVVHPLTYLKLSDLRKEQQASLLQAIWCKRKGFINRSIGESPETDKQIAKELNIW
ncbi:hypothetical protein IV487_14390 [Enterococcus saccharolyticus]|uniref:hypothetical protein n=1 Tax=Enterococcus TaxID=1350 RepID=UPI001E6536C3|nr:hypothetical protein [Enterococcus saccharolyticus]MCD5003650.1 hypothetical protein [Enterococcus saccharolyticus]